MQAARYWYKQTWPGLGEADEGGEEGLGGDGGGRGEDGGEEGVAGGGEAVLLGRMVVLDALPGPAFWLLLICPCSVSKHPVSKRLQVYPVYCVQVRYNALVAS